MKKGKSETYEMVIGTIPGYATQDGFDFTKQKTREELFLIYNKIALETEEQTGIYVPIVISKCDTLYKKEWGCPNGGEPCYKVSATRNPFFVKDAIKYETVVLKNFDALRKELKQKTAMVTKTENIDLYYFTEAYKRLGEEL